MGVAIVASLDEEVDVQVEVGIVASPNVEQVDRHAPLRSPLPNHHQAERFQVRMKLLMGKAYSALLEPASLLSDGH